jgi:hypothetical protein
LRLDDGATVHNFALLHHRLAVEEAADDGNQTLPKKRRPAPKTVLRLPDLDQAKSAVLNSLSSQMLSAATATPWMSL